MNLEKKVIGDLNQELEELLKVEMKPDEEGPYSLTYDYGVILTILCC